jgi:hypothetical protein
VREHNAAEALRHRPIATRFCQRIESAEARRILDIDPVKGLFRHRPDRRLAEIVICIDRKHNSG